MHTLFPSSYLNNKKVDEAFQKEYDAAIDVGICPILFDQIKWDEEQKIIIYGIITPNSVIYRGWMMKPDEYQLFYEKLKVEGITLLTSPKEYITLHCFPFVYPYIKSDTPIIKAYPEFYFPTLRQDGIDISSLQEGFDKFLVKDFVKSAKNTDFPAFFDKNTTQEEFDFWLKRFFEIRGNLFTEGIVIKEFVDLKKYDGKSNEYRVFYLNGIPISINRNGLQPFYTPTVPEELINKYNNLPSPFYTIDFAEKENGQWIIIETGDGGVSGLSEGQDYKAFFRAIYVSLTNDNQNKTITDEYEEKEP